MSLTKAQLDSLDTLIAKSPVIKKLNPAVTEKLTGSVRQAMATLGPELQTAFQRGHAGGGAPVADMADAVVSAVVTAVIDTVVIVTVAKPPELGAEVQKMTEANIRAIAKDRLSRAAARE